MKVVVANSAGFCFGVRRAMDKVFAVASKKKGVFTLGPIIHNPQVIGAMREQGMEVALNIQDLIEKGAKTVIVRTHGIPDELMKSLFKEGFEVIDLTCPFVKKAQHYAKLLKEEGYQVIILGDIEHPEVEGLKSFAGDAAYVVKSAENLPELHPRVGLVVQTTQSVDAMKKVISRIVEESKELKVYNTICSSTALRLKETEELAAGVDVMLVLGGKNSANTTQLAKLCNSLSVPAYHVETAAELQERWFENAAKVGITAGASTPDWIIKEVEEVLKAMGGVKTDGNQRQRT